MTNPKVKTDVIYQIVLKGKFRSFTKILLSTIARPASSMDMLEWVQEGRLNRDPAVSTIEVNDQKWLWLFVCNAEALDLFGTTDIVYVGKRKV